MDASSAITLGIGILVSAVLIGIGVLQWRSKKPVGFYSGEEPPTEKQVPDRRAWNRGHGMLWIGYGSIMLACFVLAVFVMSDPLYKALLMFAGGIFPVLLLVIGHNALIKKYKVM
ncbi:MAG: hypothetical protein IJ058_10880 [Lachnospiraceae bacterium]|nr:hypothetical protein [Lachnospiraceae bacterium]